MDLLKPLTFPTSTDGYSMFVNYMNSIRSHHIQRWWTTTMEDTEDFTMRTMKALLFHLKWSLRLENCQCCGLRCGETSFTYNNPASKSTHATVNGLPTSSFNSMTNPNAMTIFQVMGRVCTRPGPHYLTERRRYPNSLSLISHLFHTVHPGHHICPIANSPSTNETKFPSKYSSDTTQFSVEEQCIRRSQP